MAEDGLNAHSASSCGVQVLLNKSSKEKLKDINERYRKGMVSKDVPYDVTCKEYPYLHLVVPYLIIKMPC
jgi:hypothetical protein